MTFANEMNGGLGEHIRACGPGYTGEPCTGPTANWVSSAKIYCDGVLQNRSYISFACSHFMMKKYLQSIRLNPISK